MGKLTCKTRALALVRRQVGPLLLGLCACGLGSAQSNAKDEHLFLLAANINEPVAGEPATNTNLFRVSEYGQLQEEATVLEGKLTGGTHFVFPEGVYSIHDVGPYLLVEYPHVMPCCVIFVSKTRPLHPESVVLDPQNLGFVTVIHGLAQRPDGAVCELWPQTAGPPSASGDVQIAGLKTTLFSVCKKPDALPFMEKNQWAEYKYPSLDGFVRTDETWSLSDVNGRIVQMAWGGPTVEITSMPPGIPIPPRARGVNLEAASAKFLIVSINGVDGFDRNTDVFVQTRSNTGWKRLPVLPVRTTGSDQMLYRLFGDWLVTSASADLVAALPAKETVVPDVLTVIATGKQRNDLGIAAEPRTTPDVATLPARRITLWNLGDGRRIDLAIPEGDSEIVHIFDDHEVLLRIHDKLFFAEIQGSKLAGYKLAAFDSAIPQVHWAFYSSQ